MKRLVPRPAKLLLHRIRRWAAPEQFKWARELSYWASRWEAEGGHLRNGHYQRLFVAMAGEESQEFLRDKTVADFGCGPRGSLVWAEPARVRIGIDVLSSSYLRFGIARHPMCYVCSTEDCIPLPSEYVDILFTLNAMDHVNNFATICAECLRILAPGGSFIASFNLDHPATPTEPQVLTEQQVYECLLKHLRVISYRIAAPGPPEDAYRHFFDQHIPPLSGPRYLWVRAVK